MQEFYYDGEKEQLKIDLKNTNKEQKDTCEKMNSLAERLLNVTSDLVKYKEDKFTKMSESGFLENRVGVITEYLERIKEDLDKFSGDIDLTLELQKDINEYK